MNQTTKQTLIKISIVLSVLYLIYLVLDYNDCLRCIKMYVYKPSMLIDNYKCIDKTLSRTVVNIFSSVSDIKNIYPTLNSILDQTKRIDMIYVTIFDGDISEIDPVDIKKLEKIVVLIKSGSKNNVQSLILREGDINTLIININNNKIYDKTFIEDCVNKTGNCENEQNSETSSENYMIYKNKYINL
jgi:hypothetical protein